MSDRWQQVEADLKEMRNVLDDLRLMADSFKEYPLETVNNDEIHAKLVETKMLIRSKVEAMENYVHEHKPIELRGT